MSAPLLIAEAGNNHEGSMDAALELLERAKESGADAVKFQAGLAEGFARDPADIPRYRNYELGAHGYDKLVMRGRELGIQVFFSVWSEQMAKYRDLPYFKIAARQCEPQLVKRWLSHVDWKFKTVFVSVPSTFTDFTALQQVMGQAVPMHCVSQYPAQQPNLWRLPILRDAFARPVGYSDHTVGIAVPILAARMGACAIEKHFTLDHKFGPLRDHALSATPAEFKRMAEVIRG